MRPKLATATAIGVAGLTLAAVTVAWRGDVEPSVVAYVDGTPISGEAFREYKEVLEAGDRSVDDRTVLLSLINQRLAVIEANRRGFTVSSAEIDAAIDAISVEGVSDDLLGGDDGIEAFRARMRTRLLMEQVKSEVTAGVVVDDAEIAEYRNRYSAAFAGRTWESVRGEVAPLVHGEKVTAIWSAWLATARHCTPIAVTIGVELPRNDIGVQCP